jgi:hypothetical protein
MISVSALRSNIYKLLDEVVENGQPLTITRRNTELRISRVENASSRLDRLVPHDCINGDPEDLVQLDWESAWNHDLP